MSQNEGTTPRPVVYLHIGTMKSGTTNIQQRLQGNRSTVRSHGIYWASPWSQRQAKAVNELRRWSPGAAAPKLWDQVAAEMRAHPGTSILSMEFLFDATPQQIQYAVDSLSGAEIHVVVTLRDSSSAVPSQWQTGVRSGMDKSWASYARSMPVVGRFSPRLTTRIPLMKAARHFGLRHSVELVIRPWLKHIPPERFHTVIVPKSREDPDLLWKRFAQAVSVSPDAAPKEPRFSRRSLGYASASLISRINGQFKRTQNKPYRMIVRRFLSEDVLTPHAKEESPIPLSRQVYLAGIRQNVRNRNALAASGVEVVGDLDEIPITPDQARLAALPTEVEEPDVDEFLAAAQVALDALRNKTAELTPEGHEVPASPAPPGPGSGTTAWRAAPDPMRAAAEDVAAAVRVAVRAYRANPTEDDDDDSSFGGGED